MVALTMTDGWPALTMTDGGGAACRRSCWCGGGPTHGQGGAGLVIKMMDERQKTCSTYLFSPRLLLNLRLLTL